MRKIRTLQGLDFQVFLLFLAVVLVIVPLKGAFCFDSFVTKLAIVGEGAREMNTLYVLHHIVFLSVGFPTKSALKTCSRPS